jgi:RNA polymerase sigma-70 factor (ECF subfamily)
MTTTPPSAAFISEVSRSQLHLHAFIMSIIWHPSDADDVLQETNLVLWRKADEFDPTRPFLPWAIRIAQFQCLAWLKTRSRSKCRTSEALLESLVDEAIEEAPHFDPRRIALSDCLHSLPPPHQKLLAERYEPDGSVNEIAERRGSTPKAVSEMLRRIRQRLLSCVEQKLGPVQP